MLSKKTLNILILSIFITILIISTIGTVFAGVTTRTGIGATFTPDPNAPIQTDPNNPAPTDPPANNPGSGSSGGGGNGGGRSYSNSSSNPSTNSTINSTTNKNNNIIRIQNAPNTTKTITNQTKTTNITEEKLNSKTANPITGAAIGNQSASNWVIIAVVIFIAIIALTYFFLSKMRK